MMPLSANPENKVFVCNMLSEEGKRVGAADVREALAHYRPDSRYFPSAGRYLKLLNEMAEEGLLIHHPPSEHGLPHFYELSPAGRTFLEEARHSGSYPNVFEENPGRSGDSAGEARQASIQDIIKLGEAKNKVFVCNMLSEEGTKVKTTQVRKALFHYSRGAKIDKLLHDMVVEGLLLHHLPSGRSTANLYELTPAGRELLEEARRSGNYPGIFDDNPGQSGGAPDPINRLIEFAKGLPSPKQPEDASHKLDQGDITGSKGLGKPPPPPSVDKPSDDTPYRS